MPNANNDGPRRLQRRARPEPPSSASPFAEYVRRVIAQDLGEAKPKADISILFDLGKEADDIARQGQALGEAVGKSTSKPGASGVGASERLRRHIVWFATVVARHNAGQVLRDRRSDDRSRIVETGCCSTAGSSRGRVSGRSRRSCGDVTAIALGMAMFGPGVLAGRPTSFAVMERLGHARASFDRDFAFTAMAATATRRSRSYDSTQPRSPCKSPQPLHTAHPTHGTSR